MKKNFILASMLLLGAISVSCEQAGDVINLPEEDIIINVEDPNDETKEDAEEEPQVEAAVNAPKNIIFLVGDGMSYNTVTAANYYTDGVDGTASYQQFPAIYGMTTYNDGLDYDIQKAWSDYSYVSGAATDSAAAATAFSTGYKTYSGAIGVDIMKAPKVHFMQVAEELGKKTGVVSSVEFSHATPAGHVAHNESRNNYEAIANDMLSSDVDVVIGACHPLYTNDGTPSSKPNYKYVGGETTWNALTSGTHNGFTFTDDKTRVNEIAAGNNVPEKLVVVARAATTLQQSRSAAVEGQKDAKPYSAPFNTQVNTLEELSKAAINVLAKGENGFALMIEGGAIDWANHANDASRMIEEQIDFNNTVDAVVEWVEANGGWEQNLVVVTSDHECGYFLGPKAEDNNPNTNPLINNGIGQVPGHSYNSGGHTNMLVPIYVKGKGQELFTADANGIDPVVGAFLDNTDVKENFIDLLIKK